MQLNATKKKMSCRQAFPKRGRWLASLLYAFFFFSSSSIPCCRAFSSMTWTSTCSLDDVPVESVPTAGAGGGRRLLGGAFASRRRSEEDEEGPAAQLEGRRCDCALAYDGDVAYYCPLPADRCSVLRQRYSRSVRVECFRHGDWVVGFARHVWYYLCFILLILGLYLLCSTPGQVRAAVCRFCERAVPPRGTLRSRGFVRGGGTIQLVYLPRVNLLRINMAEKNSLAYLSPVTNEIMMKLTCV